jgi:peptide-methionine (S)-S-oxide reductase
MPAALRRFYHRRTEKRYCMKRGVFTVLVLAALAGFWSARPGTQTAPPATGVAPGLAKATFAGGCFWCMEPPFDRIAGVVSTTSGYIGGRTRNPTYAHVSSGGTGHAEAVEVVYDPQQVSYERLLEIFWHNVDPLDAGGQFCDRGSQYRTGIFFHDDEQKRLAEASKAKLQASGRFDRPIVTEVVAATTFYPAEEYHQDYYTKNPVRYKFYRYNCGRDRRLEQLWGKAPS